MPWATALYVSDMIGLIAALVVSAPPQLSDAAWLAGHWVSNQEKAVAEEIWTAPRGNSMLGTFRLVEGGRLKFAEVMTLLQEKDAVVLRIRHFSPELDPWEKDGPNTWTATSLTAERLMFEAKGSPVPKFEFIKRGKTGMRVRLTFKAGKVTDYDFVLAEAPR